MVPKYPSATQQTPGERDREGGVGSGGPVVRLGFLYTRGPLTPRAVRWTLQDGLSP